MNTADAGNLSAKNQVRNQEKLAEKIGRKNQSKIDSILTIAGPTFRANGTIRGEKFDGTLRH